MKASSILSALFTACVAYSMPRTASHQIVDEESSPQGPLSPIVMGPGVIPGDSPFMTCDQHTEHDLFQIRHIDIYPNPPGMYVLEIFYSLSVLNSMYCKQLAQKVFCRGKMTS